MRSQRHLAAKHIDQLRETFDTIHSYELTQARHLRRKLPWSLYRGPKAQQVKTTAVSADKFSFLKDRTCPIDQKRNDKHERRGNKQ
jgi:hypothetical protein